MKYLFLFQTPVEIERRRRIRLSLWAYAYEVKNNPLVSDDIFDKEAYKVDLSMDTGNKKMDGWFRNNFVPWSGQWILKHPELDKLERIYDKSVSR